MELAMDGDLRRGSQTGPSFGDRFQTLLRNPRCIPGTLLVLVILIVSSISTVGPTEYGLKYNRITLTVSPNWYGPGRVFTGFWQTMIRYPSVVQTIEFSDRNQRSAPPLRTRTDEGLDLTVHVAFQFKLKPTALQDVYKTYLDQYTNVFVRQSASALLKAASKFEAEQYWLERAVVTKNMNDEVSELFKDVANITGLEVMIIDLPASFENKIVDTQVQVQTKLTREAEQTAAIIRAQIEVMLSNFTKQEQIILNTANAQKSFIEQEAQAHAQKNRIDVENEAIEVVKNQINLSSAGLVNYQRGIAYQNLEEAQFLFGVQQTAAIVSMQASMQGGMPSEFELAARGTEL